VNAFEAPVDDHDGPSWSFVTVLVAWGLAGATVGTAAGATLQVLSIVENGAPIGLGAALFGALVGGGALIVERSRADRRPELVDTRGQRSRPLHGLLLGLPVLVSLPAIAWLVVVVSIGWASWVPAVVFSMLGVGVAWGGQRVWSSHRLTRALEHLELGQRDVAVRELELLARSLTASRGVRTAARLNLAMLALAEGDGDAAVEWAEVPAPSSGAYAWAAVTRALGHLLRGDAPDEAEDWLLKAVSGPGARAVQPEADAVRVLLVWRRDGAGPARRVADELWSPAATTLHRAMLLVLRQQSGEPADDLRTEEVEGLLHGGLGRAIPELRAR
jgi:hypothetical protein